MSSTRRILQLLKMKSNAQAELQNLRDCNSSIGDRTLVFSKIYAIDKELNLYTDEEVKNAINTSHLKEKVEKSMLKRNYVETEEEQTSFLFLLVMMIILMSKAKNKAFLMLGLALIVSPTERVKRITNTI